MAAVGSNPNVSYSDHKTAQFEKKLKPNACVWICCSRHETEPTVVILVDRRHNNWSSVKSILHAINVSHILIYSASEFLIFGFIL